MGIRPVERDWEWEFSPSPAALWPVLADTARFNEAAGLPRYTVTDVSQPDGSVRRVGAARRFGLALSWEEGVPQWIAGKSFSHERRFGFGPFRRVVTEIDIHPASNGGSRVRYRLSIEPRGWLSAILLRCGFLARVGRMIDRLFRQAAEFAEASRADAFRSAPPVIAASIRRSVAIRARTLADQGYGTAERLAAHLLEAAETDLERMRPRALARRWGAEPRAAIETCLAAAREGLLMLRWDLLCRAAVEPKSA
jgi:hypothetical protein